MLGLRAPSGWHRAARLSLGPGTPPRPSFHVRGPLPADRACRATWCRPGWQRWAAGLAHGHVVERLLDRAWLLPRPDAGITQVGRFSVLRDDLTDPVVHGNKLRKLDGLWPALLAGGCRAVVACGGAQSANLVALAALAARSHGAIAAHLLVRGERPVVPVGNALLQSLLAGRTLRYVSRSEFADREAMLGRAVEALQSDLPPGAVVAMPEGAAVPAALLGCVRLVRWLAATPGLDQDVTLVLDCGTGTTAAGLALGCVLCSPETWRVAGVAVAAPESALAAAAAALLARAETEYGLAPGTAAAAAARIDWLPRPRPRKFGRILPGDGDRVRRVATGTGILLDPVWTLAAWEAGGNKARRAHVTHRWRRQSPCRRTALASRVFLGREGGRHQVTGHR